ncbi:MAG: protein kinase domain-containing protein, partial [Chthoniobacterales bacterium]
MKTILADALELESPKERTAFLHDSCEGDTLLLQEIEALLAQATHNLEECAADTPISFARQASPQLSGERIGTYEMVRELGRGGMGSVYLARRADGQFEKEVAIKLLKRGTDTDEILRRFQAERRILARLDHPNIARLLDAGTTQDDLPYFVMEYVDGVPITAYARDNKLTTTRRLELFLKVCAAVQVAHQHLIVHRDLKPSNILVTQEGEPKLLDFGIAKLLATGDEGIELTLTAERRFTPVCASPEQARGETITPASDVYALGALLYELLTDRPPHRFSTPHPSQAEVAQVIGEQEPTRPSLSIYDNHVRRQLRGDLDKIVLMALRKEPARRYPSVAEFAEDIRRHLDGRAVRARSNTAGYLTTRFIARHKQPIGALIVAMTVALLFILFYRPTRANSPQELRAAAVLDKSIAVLPLKNLSDAKDDAYLADAIQDEILTRLSKIGDLKVISRTSTQHYKSAPENLPEIARQLGVANILEGSVQKNGDIVRVNVQLIKAANDSHLWADTFDRKLTDIFSVESEVAKAIADQLQAKLTGQEEQVIAARPTNNPEAYDAYLRGLAYNLKTGNTAANSLGAQKYLREAVKLDPNFALAWALLSVTDSRGYITSTLQPTVALREEARQAAETALTFQPNLGEGLLAKGHYYYACLKDYDSAVRYFEQARQFLPNSSRVPEALAAAARRRGQWDQSDTYFNEAERLDPRNVYLLTQHARSYLALRRFPEALRKFDQVLDITPDDVSTLVQMAIIAQAQGDLPRASAILAPLHPNADDFRALETQVNQAILERHPAQIIPRLKEIMAKPDPALGYINGELRFWLGWAQDVAGDQPAAQESWRQARSELESFLKEQPENFALIGHLALTNMGLGDKAAALALAERAVAANPIEKDAVNGPDPIEFLARVAAGTGEADRAIAALQKLLSIPYNGAMAAKVPLTPALLRLDPMFDPLRKDPRFAQVLESTRPNEPISKGDKRANEPVIADKSIAVLPFENLSDDKANSFFAAGIQDELITDLAQVAELKVISRASVTQYTGPAARNVREIARELGVAHLLAGTVQRSGNRIRVNA